jgi:hypothetical protein
VSGEKANNTLGSITSAKLVDGKTERDEDRQKTDKQKKG